MPTRAEGLGLTVNSPCTAEWDSMAGNEQIRFCTHCEKSVHNLSTMTRKDALRFVRANAAGVCVRFYSDPRGRTIHTNDRALYRITRRASKVAAGAFGAAVALGASVLAQTPQGGQEVVAAVRIDTREAASLTGTILDPNGAVVSGARVIVFNSKTGEAKTATTDEGGLYHFESLTPGTYTVMFAAEGFEAERVEKVELQQGVEQRRDSMLVLPGMRPAQIEVAKEAEEEEEEEAEDKNASCPTTAGDESKPAEESASVEITEVPLSQEGEPVVVRRIAVMGAVAIRVPKNPLVKAVFEGNARAAKNLIALGADVNVLDKEADTTALIQAVSHNEAEIVSALITAGADVNMKDGDGDTALTRLQEDATVALVRALTSAGAKVNHKNQYGSTPLINAAENDTPEVLKELIESGAKINARNKSGRTALMEAAQYGLIENVKLLLDAGADVNMKDKEGGTALKLAKELATVYSEEAEEGEELSESEKAKKIKEAEESDETKMSKKVVALLVARGAIEE